MGVWEESNSFRGWGEHSSDAENVGEGWSTISERQ